VDIPFPRRLIEVRRRDGDQPAVPPGA
jgi:hypothetical protein